MLQISERVKSEASPGLGQTNEMEMAKAEAEAESEAEAHHK